MSTNPAPGAARAARDTAIGSFVLAGVLGGAVAVALAIDTGRPHWGRAVAFAAVVVGVGGLAGWLVERLAVTDPTRWGAGALGATVLRLVPGIAALAWLSDRGGPLREAGAGGLVVAFYLALLAAAILLHMMLGQGPSGQPPDSRR